MRQDRTDRIIVILAMLVLIGAVGLFYFDGWMWGSSLVRGARIGLVSSRQGDVRVKFAGELKWQKAMAGQELMYNDSIYAGGASEADLKLGESVLRVTENTLIVLRYQKNVSFLNLSYGTLVGRVGAGEKLMIETGDGKPVELKSVGADTEIRLKKVGDKTQLDVTSGDAEIMIDNKVTAISKDQRVFVDDKVIEPIKIVNLKAIKPTRNQIVYSEEQKQIEFAWAFEDGREATANDLFTLEFSSDPTFAKVSTKKTIQGKLESALSVSQSLSLYYRVKGPGGAVSQTEQVRFVQMKKPLIIKPLSGFTYEAIEGQTTPVEIEFEKDSNANVWYQVATDEEFADVIVNQNVSKAQISQDLGIGLYYLRARSDYGDNRITGWTDTRIFQVDKKIEELRLTEAELLDKVIIPNRRYPESLYSASAAKASEYLSDKKFLAQYFAKLQGQSDEVKLRFEDGDMEIAVAGSAWPKQKLYPGTFKYRYQMVKDGYLPSTWSEVKKLEIAVEPPKPLGEATYGEVMTDGRMEARWKFTNVLFAKSYDIEVADNPGFVRAKEINGSGNEVLLPLAPGQYYWRARARDFRGRIISTYSPAYTLAPMPEVVPQMLALEENQGRGPADEDEPAGTTTSRIVEAAPQIPWTKSGWWAWLGTGFNYVDYRQAVPGRLSLDYQNIKGPSQYFEGGYWANSGTGLLFTYKNTPGEVRIANATLDVPTYSWTTLSLEVLKRKTSDFKLLGSRIIYGLRAGVQQHKTPFIFIDAYGDPKMRRNEMNTASVGFLSELNRNRWTYYWLMRYQFPFSSRADQARTYDLTPVFAFDGSLGASYNFSKQIKLGLFWYGQLHQYGFSYGDDEVLNDGTQTLFYSNMDLRLGVDF